MNHRSTSLVLGTATRLSVAQVTPFVESLRRHFDGDVMLLVSSANSAPLVAYLRQHHITPVFFDCADWMRMNLSTARFVRYGEILRSSPQTYQQVLLTDVSDVIFQGHPFNGLPPGDLFCFLEYQGRLIRDCHDNSMWIEQHLGPEALARIKNQTISCAGTLIGSHAAVLEYVDSLLAHANPQKLAMYIGMRGFDQGIHNFLLHTGALPKAAVVPNGIHAYTMGCVPDDHFILGEGGAILTPDRRLCPIVHQYTYKSAAMAHVNLARDRHSRPVFFVRGTPYGN